MRIILIMVISIITLAGISLIGTAASSSNVAGTGFNNNVQGDVAWSNTALITANDNTYADVTLTSGQSSQVLSGTNFGFSIPAGSTINGIEVAIEVNYPVSTTMIDLNSSLILSDASIGGTNRANSSTIAETTITYGGASDTWGESLTTTDVNNANFGFAFRVERTGGFGNTIEIDHYTMTVYYTESATNVTDNVTLTMSDSVLEVKEGVIEFT